MDESKSHWMDHDPISEKEYDELRVLLYKLQARLMKNKYSDRTEGRNELNKVLNDLHLRLFRNTDRIYFD